MDGASNNARNRLIRRISLVGESEGEVRRLKTFEKSRHTSPKFASDRAQQFLHRLVEAELTEWGEELFSAFRDGLEYRRKEIALTIEYGAARIDSKDFTLERRYSLIDDRPNCYVMTTELMRVSSVDLLELGPFNQAIGPQFDRLKCLFAKEISIEDIVDGIEDMEGSELSVRYPSTCDYCEVRVRDLEVAFHFDPATLEVRFASLKMPSQLWDSYRSLAEAMAPVDTINQWLTSL